MSSVVFVAPVQDPSTPTTVYGRGHQASITDEAFVLACIQAGKAAYQGATIRNPRVTALGTTTASVTFTVDQACTGMLANYGTTTGYGSNQNATPTSGSGDIVINFTGLTTGTTYHYRISVTVGTYTTLTGDLTFRTN